MQRKGRRDVESQREWLGEERKMKSNSTVSPESFQPLEYTTLPRFGLTISTSHP